MPKTISIKEYTSDNALNIVIDTLETKKQALVFCNSKRSCEKAADDIARKVAVIDANEKLLLEKLSYDVLNALPKPTTQCERLARCVKRGIAYHHAGLVAEQKSLIEDAFRANVIKIICCTPTLCISKDTLIWHNCDETKVSEIDNAHTLFALSSNRLIHLNAQKIEQNMNHSKLVQISSVSGHKIKLTPNHKILIKRKSKKMLICADKITKCDRIATIGRIKVSNLFNPSVKCFVHDVILPVNNFEFCEELSYLIGVMLGDGHSGAETVNGAIKYKESSPSIVGRDEEIFNSAAETCKKLSISVRRAISYNGVPTIVLGKNKWFREFLVRCGVEKGENKHISPKLMHMDLENTIALLQGLFDTDGYLDNNIGPGFCNTSLRLVKQAQKLLLRFGIVSTLRTKNAGVMKIYGREYKTKQIYELNIHQKKCIIDFYRFIGFRVKRKQEGLINVVARIFSNVNYVSCEHCKYRIYRDLFSGRTKDQKMWGQQKLEIIKLLGYYKELSSRKLKSLLGQEVRKKDTRLNHHYELIKKRRIGQGGDTDYIWGLNAIGQFIYDIIIGKDKRYIEFFSRRTCPLCDNNLEWVIKKGWREDDFEGDIFWDQIRNIKEIDPEPIVYDVVLPTTPKNDHMFVADGFIIHNSYGLDMPASRVIVKDLRRYGHKGMEYIPVLEYHQMAGRAGRPGKSSIGEAITLASTEAEKGKIIDKFINGDAEEIYSKLAVEPVLRFYLLSLISTNFVRTRTQIMDFFNKTFWAYQYGDMYELMKTINKMLLLLEGFGFIESSRGNAERLRNTVNLRNADSRAYKPSKVSTASDSDDFMSADELYSQSSALALHAELHTKKKSSKHAADKHTDNTYEDEKFSATTLGKRVAELYIDPLTAYEIIYGLKTSKTKGSSVNNSWNVDRQITLSPLAILQLISNTLELRPKLRVKTKEYEEVMAKLLEHSPDSLVKEPSEFDPEFDEFIYSFKTALFLYDWIEENDEEFLLEKYDVRPGEIKAKLDIADWLLYAAIELCKILGIKEMNSELNKMRLRLEYGAKEELLPLLKLKSVGRVRARKLFGHGIKDLGDVKKAGIVTLAQLVGKATAISIKEQIGEKADPEEIKIKENKRKGQISLMDY